MKIYTVIFDYKDKRSFILDVLADYIKNYQIDIVDFVNTTAGVIKIQSLNSFDPSTISHKSIRSITNREIQPIVDSIDTALTDVSMDYDWPHDLQYHYFNLRINGGSELSDKYGKRVGERYPGHTPLTEKTISFNEATASGVSSTNSAFSSSEYLQYTNLTENSPGVGNWAIPRCIIPNENFQSQSISEHVKSDEKYVSPEQPSIPDINSIAWQIGFNPTADTVDDLGRPLSKSIGGNYVVNTITPNVLPIIGCTNPNAINFNPLATQNAGCQFAPTPGIDNPLFEGQPVDEDGNLVDYQILVENQTTNHKIELKAGVNFIGSFLDPGGNVAATITNAIFTHVNGFELTLASALNSISIAVGDVTLSVGGLDPLSIELDAPWENGIGIIIDAKQNCNMFITGIPLEATIVNFDPAVATSGHFQYTGVIPIKITDQFAGKYDAFDVLLDDSGGYFSFNEESTITHLDPGRGYQLVNIKRPFSFAMINVLQPNPIINIEFDQIQILPLGSQIINTEATTNEVGDILTFGQKTSLFASNLDISNYTMETILTQFFHFDSAADTTGIHTLEEVAKRVVLVKDGTTGNQFFPHSGTDGIGNLINGRGYEIVFNMNNEFVQGVFRPSLATSQTQVNANTEEFFNAAELRIKGNTLINTTIDFSVGFNSFGNTRQTPVRVSEIFGDHLFLDDGSTPKINLLKDDGSGEIFIVDGLLDPTNEFLEPGKSYKLKAAQTFSVII